MARQARRLFVIDAETNPFDKENDAVISPFIWGVYDGEIFLYFDTPAEIVEFFRDKEAVVYAHNGGKFDYRWILPLADPFTKVKVINGRVASFKIGKTEYRDSYLILPTALRNYKKEDIPYELMRPEFRSIPENRRKIIAYLKSDCLYLFQLVTKFRETHGKTALTLAGASMTFWRKMTGITPERTTRGFYDLFKPYYHGGRVQAFKKGVYRGNFTYYDINSAYPKAMTCPHAFGADFDYLDRLPDPDEIPTSFIRLDGVCNGAFPVFEKHEGDSTAKLYFPTDNKAREYTITGHEYLAARETGALGIHAIREARVFPKKMTFRSYVSHFYELKKNAKDDGEKLVAKISLNALYGKWAAAPHEYREYMIVPPSQIMRVENGYYPDADGYEFDSFTWGDFALMSRPLPEPARRYYNVATAASITGWVRAYLWRSICQAKNVYYCDTDSMIAEGFDGRISKDLGDWKIEGRADLLAIGGRKQYALFNLYDDVKTSDEYRACIKKACKGGRLSADQILSLAEGKTVVYKNEAPTISIHSRGFEYLTRTFKAD